MRAHPRSDRPRSAPSVPSPRRRPASPRETGAHPTTAGTSAGGRSRTGSTPRPRRRTGRPTGRRATGPSLATPERALHHHPLRLGDPDRQPGHRLAEAARIPGDPRSEVGERLAEAHRIRGRAEPPVRLRGGVVVPRAASHRRRAGSGRCSRRRRRACRCPRPRTEARRPPRRSRRHGPRHSRPTRGAAPCSRPEPAPGT